MFKRFIDWIVAVVSDYVNPIVVRDMRLGFGKWGAADKGMIAYACLLVVGCLIAYFSCESDLLESLINRVVMGFDNIAEIILYVCICWVGSIMGIFSVLLCIEKNSKDEMFLIVPMSPRRYLHAYMFEAFILTSFYTFSIMPVVLIIFGNVSNFPALIAIILCGNNLVAQVGILTGLSFSCPNKPPIQTDETSQKRPLTASDFLGFAFLGSIILFLLPWFLLGFVWIDYFRWQAINTHNIFGFVSIYILLPIGLLSICAMGYKLSLYGFKTRGKKIIKRFFLNIFCYTLLSVAMALVYFYIAFVVFTFL